LEKQRLRQIFYPVSQFHVLTVPKTITVTFYKANPGKGYNSPAHVTVQFAVPALVGYTFSN
jgi:hypothetical protein